jgi:hypothetical protein
MNPLPARTLLIAFLALDGAGLGCAGRPARGPLQPAWPDAPAAPPLITAVSPDAGSTGGYTPITITGTGFQPGATVMLDGLTLQGKLDRRSKARLSLLTPAHSGGRVDILVINPDGQAHRLTRGYTYAAPQSFDFNGNWSGYTHSKESVHVVIRNNELVSVSCGSFATLVPSPRPSVSNGEFSFSKDNGVVVSGRIVSASAAVGTMNLAPCAATTWRATRQ